jgi:hypothetical protein
MDAINYIALSFATAKPGSPKSRFRRICWLYHYLKTNSAPITAPFTWALWHAGVTRFADRGPCRTQINWITKIVAEVEGSRVADQLLTSPSYRAKRNETFSTYMAREAVETEQQFGNIVRLDDAYWDQVPRDKMQEARPRRLGARPRRERLRFRARVEAA